jgi:NAD-dependent deacetylase
MDHFDHDQGTYNGAEQRKRNESEMDSSTHGWSIETLERLTHSRLTVVLTGAGMSAESGIPTFRDAMTGHWARYRPEDLATPEAFAADPGRVWDWYEARREGVRSTAPHAGHQALAELESVLAGLVVVTQNVDGFHHDAGSTRIIELHGNIMRSVCSKTRQVIPAPWLEEQGGNPPPSPHHPEGLARPDVVWFGEALPPGALEEAWSLAEQADVLLSIGTSSLVQPAASLPLVALEAGAWVVEVNPDPTPLSRQAHQVLRQTAGAALTGLQRALEES